MHIAILGDMFEANIISQPANLSADRQGRQTRELDGLHWSGRVVTEQRSSAQTRALLASALSDEDRDPLMREGAGWSEDKVAEEALAI